MLTLFDSLKIGDLTIPNRIIMAADTLQGGRGRRTGRSERRILRSARQRRADNQRGNQCQPAIMRFRTCAGDLDRQANSRLAERDGRGAPRWRVYLYAALALRSRRR